jgi:magnesium transporter
MAAKKANKIKKAGLPPGSVVYTGSKKDEQVDISLIEFNADMFRHEKNCQVSKLKGYISPDTTTWINVNGIHNTDIIEDIGKQFNIHPLVLEDIVNIQHRPKVEDLGDYIFFTCKLLDESKENSIDNPDQISLLLGSGWIISFMEQPTHIFNEFIERIEQSKGIVRTRKADYIFYRIIDIIIDNYFYITDQTSDTLVLMDEAIIKDDKEGLNKDIHDFKKLLTKLRKVIVPLRDSLNTILRDDYELISEPVTHYIRDAYEHILQITEIVESQRDTAGGLLDLYMTAISNKMNQIMQVLTMFATIFIPLTFIAGIYGMNFDYMPELHWKYGYLTVWGLMLAVGIGFVIYFRRKKWL